MKTVQQINDSYSLTPWEKECERKILASGMPQREADLLRIVYKLKDAIDSRQHWAGDSYTQYLSDKAADLINKLPDVTI